MNTNKKKKIGNEHIFFMLEDSVDINWCKSQIQFFKFNNFNLGSCLSIRYTFNQIFMILNHQHCPVFINKADYIHLELERFWFGNRHFQK